MPSLAKRVAPDGILNVKKIGDAAVSLRTESMAWVDRGMAQKFENSCCSRKFAKIGRIVTFRIEFLHDTR